MLVVGGYDENWNELKSSEIYDPATSTWALAGDMSVARGYAPNMAVRLQDGRVLAIAGQGGSGATADIFSCPNAWDTP